MGKNFIFFVIFFCCVLNSSAIAADGVRLGVLEFENITGDTTFKWVSRGIQESLSSKLASLPNVVVIERGQINKILEEQRLQISGFVDTNTAVEVGKVIGIKKAVTGSYQVSSSAILINARVVDVETAETEEGFEVQGGVDQIFTHYTKLATDLSGALDSSGGSTPVQVDTLATQAKQEITRQDTNSFSAYEYYTKANEIAFGSDSWITAMIDLIDKGKEVSDSPETTQQAIDLLKKAVEVDPNYARAWALLGMSYGVNNETSNAENAMNKALALAKDDPFILCTFGVFAGFSMTVATDSNKSLAAFQQVRRDFPNTYYSGLASLFVVLVKINQDMNWMLSNNAEGLTLLTEARTNMPEAGFVRAFHGMFAILNLFTELETTFAGDNLSLSTVSGAKRKLDVAVIDIDDYIKYYPNSMLVQDIGAFLPDAKALQAMFGALETVMTIQEKVGGDPYGVSNLADTDKSKYIASLKLNKNAMDDYKQNYPQGQMVPIIDADVLPTVDLFIQSLESDDSGYNGYDDGGFGKDYGQFTDQDGYDQTYETGMTLDEGLLTASDYLINGYTYEAIDLLAALDIEYPNIYEIYYLMSMALITAGDMETAASLLITTLDMWPNQPDPYYWIGYMYDYAGDYATAYDYYTTYLNLSPQGDFSVDAYNRAIEIENMYNSYSGY